MGAEKEGGDGRVAAGSELDMKPTTTSTEGDIDDDVDPRWLISVEEIKTDRLLCSPF